MKTSLPPPSVHRSQPARPDAAWRRERWTWTSTAPPLTTASPSFARSLSAGLEVRPTDFLDGWWLHEAAPGPTTPSSPTRCATRRSARSSRPRSRGSCPRAPRSCAGSSSPRPRSRTSMVAYEDTLVAMSVDASYVWMAVAARDAKHAAYVKDTLLDAFPEGEDIPAGEAKVPFFVWTAGSAALRRRPPEPAEGRPVGGDPRQLRARDRRRARRALRRVRARARAGASCCGTASPARGSRTRSGRSRTRGARGARSTTWPTPRTSSATPTTCCR